MISHFFYPLIFAIIVIHGSSPDNVSTTASSTPVEAPQKPKLSEWDKYRLESYMDGVIKTTSDPNLEKKYQDYQTKLKAYIKDDTKPLPLLEDGIHLSLPIPKSVSETIDFPSLKYEEHDCLKEINSNDVLIVVDIQNDFMPSTTFTYTNSYLNFYDKRLEALKGTDLEGYKKAMKLALKSDETEPINPFPILKNGDTTKDGSLSVYDAHRIFPQVNNIIEKFERKNAHIIYSLDAHTENHCSFSNDKKSIKKGENRCLSMKDNENRMGWPAHCIAGQRGSQLYWGLYLSSSSKTRMVKKGFLEEDDSYSAFGGRLSHYSPIINKDEFMIADSIKENNLESRPSLGSYLEREILPTSRIFVVGIAEDYCVKETAKDASKKWQTFVIENATGAVGPKMENVEKLTAEWAKGPNRNQPGMIFSKKVGENINFCKEQTLSQRKRIFSKPIEESVPISSKPVSQESPEKPNPVDKPQISPQEKPSEINSSVNQSTTTSSSSLESTTTNSSSSSIQQPTTTNSSVNQFTQQSSRTDSSNSSQSESNTNSSSSSSQSESNTNSSSNSSQLESNTNSSSSSS